MSVRNSLVICIGLSVASCVPAPVYKNQGHALVRSSHAIVSVNGVEAEPVYILDISAGENTLVARYPTYRYSYYCTFVWTAAAATTYEITDQEKQYPLTLYRWVRRNALWSVRLDPIDPIKCTRER